MRYGKFPLAAMAMLCAGFGATTTRHFAARPKEPDPAQDLAGGFGGPARPIELRPPDLYQYTPMAAEAFTPYLHRRRRSEPTPATLERRAQLARLLNPRRR